MQQPNKQEDDGKNAKQVCQNCGTVRTHVDGTRDTVSEFVIRQKELLLLTWCYSGMVQSYRVFLLIKFIKDGIA